MVYEASGPSRWAIAPATSSGSPARPSGIRPAAVSGRSGTPERAWMVVRMMPGATALTRMPRGASSFASPTVRVSVAALTAA